MRNPLPLLLLAPTAITAQEAVGPTWVVVLPGKSVYADRDSIWKIGPDTYRAVIITDVMPGFRNIDTDEIRCAEHAARTVRSRAVGSRVRQGKADTATPAEPFEKVYLGGPADVKYQAVCALAGSLSDRSARRHVTLRAITDEQKDVRLSASTATGDSLWSGQNADGYVRLELLGRRDDIRRAVVRTRFRSLPPRLRSLADARAELVLHLFAPDWSDRVTWLDAATARALAGAGPQKASHASIGVTISYDSESGMLSTTIENHAA